MLLDGAHNSDGAAALAKALKDASGKKKKQAFAFICGMCADKDVEGFLKTLSPLMTKAWTVPVASPRTLPPEKTAEIARRFKVEAEVRHDVSTAIRDAQTWAQDHDAVVVICGSLFLVGEVLHQQRQCSTALSAIHDGGQAVGATG
jgi:dihydrofolate synthase/folylpolyglutamate synthase